MILFGDMWIYLRSRLRQSLGTIAFCDVLFAIQTYTLFGTPTTSMTGSAISAIIAYFVFGLVI